MATGTSKAKARTTRKSTAKPRTASIGGLDIGKHLEQIKFGKFTWDDLLKSTSKNMDAVAEANRAIIDGYTDIARRQFAMLKELLRELRKVRGDRDAVVKELKRVIKRAKGDVQALQKLASKTNSKAQRIVKKRAEANLKAWQNMVAEARKSVSQKLPAMKKSVAGKKAAPKKAAAKRKAAPRKKAAARKRPAATKPKTR